MPFKSKAQRKKMYALEEEGKVPKGTAAEWESETKKKNLPEHVARRVARNVAKKSR
jgi:hypothetical protein